MQVFNGALLKEKKERKKGKGRVLCGGGFRGLFFLCICNFDHPF